MKNKALVLLAFLGLTVSGVCAESSKVLAGDPASSSREVKYRAGEIVTISVQRGYVTVVEIPENAVAVICGDCKEISKDGKVIDDSAGKWAVQLLPDTNKLTVAASEHGAKTNVHVMGASGKLYTLSLREISQVAGEHADLLVRISHGDGGAPSSVFPSQVKYVSVLTADSYKNQAATAQQALKEQQEKSATDLAAARVEARAQVEQKIVHQYVWEQNKQAETTFGVKAIYLLDGFTVIEASPQEAPAFYEVRGRDESLIQFTFSGGKYVAPKEIIDGYLKIGKSKLTFHKQVKNG